MEVLTNGGPHIRSTPPVRLHGAQRDVYFSRGAVSTFGCSLEPCVLAAGSQRSPLCIFHAARTEI